VYVSGLLVYGFAVEMAVEREASTLYLERKNLKSFETS